MSCAFQKGVQGEQQEGQPTVNSYVFSCAFAETLFEEQASPQHVVFLGRKLPVYEDYLPQKVFLSYLTNSLESFLIHTIHVQTAVRKAATIN